ncbi:hypothetical protein BC830DRAFT_1078735 [Chytriomyces sp. MP71]|nr:hypothetical protein BC830DRAFT_1078735 [Chytriomyces sp. MP71]
MGDGYWRVGEGIVMMACIFSLVVWTTIVAHASKFPHQIVFGDILTGNGDGIGSEGGVDTVPVGNVRLLVGHERLGLVIRRLLEENKQATLYDFHNHLDNCALDWLTNKELEAAFDQ